MGAPDIVYALAPQKGRIGKARQVPIVRIPVERIEQNGDTTLGEHIEQAFHKYSPHGCYSGIVDMAGGLFGTVPLYCNLTNNEIATIIITKEYA